MVKVYTALGRFDTKLVKSKSGKTVKVPIVKMKDKDYILSADELIIWSSLAWNILTKDELTTAFNNKRTELRNFADVSVNAVISGLAGRGLIAAGQDILLTDAVYRLISNLKIYHLKVDIWAKIRSFAHLVLVRRVAVKKALRVFKEYAPDIDSEVKILKLVSKMDLSTAELIKCFDSGNQNINSVEKLIDAICETDSTAGSLAGEMQFSDYNKLIIQAITNLYINRSIIFEK